MRLLVGAWLVFYGLVLTAMMVAHSIDILYSTYAGGLTMHGVLWAYDFRTYGLHLLGAVLIWQGVRSIRAAHVGMRAAEKWGSVLVHKYNKT